MKILNKITKLKYLQYFRKPVFIAGILTAALLIIIYNYFFSPTDIALVNYPDFVVAKIEGSKSFFIKVHRFNIKSYETLEILSGYDAVYINGMGLRLSEKQSTEISRIIKSGIKVYVHNATNPDYDFTNISGEELEYIKGYFEHGGPENYKALLNYTRRTFDKKSLFTDPLQEPVPNPEDYFFYPETEEIFPEIEEYEKYLSEKNSLHKGARKIAIFISNVSPLNSGQEHLALLFRELNSYQYNVYPVRTFRKRLEYLKKIKPDVVIYFPHGKFSMGATDETRKWLKDNNVLLLTPLNIFTPRDEWEKSQSGMQGGMLSQSIVMPELDGGIQPYVISAQEKDSGGYYVFKPIPERIRTFASMINKWINLKQMSNRNKKVAIVYFKGPGKNSMVAGGMEVVPSLYNLLKYLKQQGYNTGGLPENEEKFEDLIQRRGSVPGPYALGAIDKFIKHGSPELISKKILDQWMTEYLKPEMKKSVQNIFGESPGQYMTVEKESKMYLALPRIEFGNIVILPQPLAGLGEDTYKIVHGVKQAPPYPYIAAYLWIKHGFKADAVFHFGTHGSLEFTPWKQVALSSYDWPDALIGGMPHGYIYVINNIGEAVIAKRRTYAVLTSYLTPSFDESGLYGDLSKLHNKIHSFKNAENPALKEAYLSSVKNIAIKLGLDKDLGIIDLKKNKLTPELLETIHSYVHTVEEEKITQGLHTLGKSYTPDKINRTAELMALDAVADSMAGLDVLKGKVSHNIIKDKHYFEKNYRSKAIKMIRNILYNNADPGQYIESKDQKLLKDEDKKLREQKGSFMMMFASSSDKSAEKSKEESETEIDSTTRETVKTLVILNSNIEEKKKFLLSLKEEKTFKKISGLTDPDNLSKAKNLARMIPKMKQTLDLATEPDMLELITLMGKKKQIRDLVFGYLDNDKIIAEIKKEQLKASRKKLQRMLSDKYFYKLVNSLKKKDFLKTSTGKDKSRVGELRDVLNFFIENKDIPDSIESEHKNYIALKAILKSAKSVAAIKERIAEADKVLASIEEEEKEYINTVRTYVTALNSVRNYRNNLKISGVRELEAVAGVLSGGYIEPSSGGDLIINPKAAPTGRNLISIDAENTPDEEAWKVGVTMAKTLLERKKKSTGEYPRKVAFTLWGGEFIRARGATIAQIFYLLGVEPVRSPRGRINDVRLIPGAELKRPRVDVIVQTSGQFRDIAASRIFLINKAVKLAANAEDDNPNYVKEGSIAAEKAMKESGLSPADAAMFANARVFGGVNGNYGSNIMGLVESGDKWKDDKEISDQYLKNMGAVYTKDNWGVYKEGIFSGAMQNTDTIVHPRSSNVSGPLSLDHVYEFMGGLNATIRNVTGKDPDAYFSDLRNPHKPSMQGLKEAIWTETRTTLSNPKYIKEMLQGGASSAEKFAETFRNTYGWNVMKPAAIDKELWEELYSTYIEDRQKLGIHKFFIKRNPFAMQEMSAVMLETIRKGYWKADDQKIKNLAKLHAELLNKHKAGCSNFVCNNAKLKDYIAKSLPENLQKNYLKEINEARETGQSQNALRLKKEEFSLESVSKVFKDNKEMMFMLGGLLVFFAGIIVYGIVRQKRSGEKNDLS